MDIVLLVLKVLGYLLLSIAVFSIGLILLYIVVRTMTIGFYAGKEAVEKRRNRKE